MCFWFSDLSIIFLQNFQMMFSSERYHCIVQPFDASASDTNDVINICFSFKKFSFKDFLGTNLSPKLHTFEVSKGIHGKEDHRHPMERTMISNQHYVKPYLYLIKPNIRQYHKHSFFIFFFNLF